MSSDAERDRLHQAVLRHVALNLGATLEELSPRERFFAASLAVRDRLIERMLQTERRYRQADAKRLYYLSMEFLIGRSLVNNLVNMNLLDPARAALADMGLSLDDLDACEPDAALGNGGLGRLAACFLDSLATLGMPGYGYGINYEYGLFRQQIHHGEQVEKADNWRTYATPWEVEREQDAVMVPMYGRIEHARDRSGGYNPMWLDWKVVVGVPYDMLIPGYGGHTVNTLRLFSAHASQDLDMAVFNEGDYFHAVQQKVATETISKVLYPRMEFAVGRELRLVQEYFLSACAVRDIVRRYQRDHETFDEFADKVAIQLNDTHPTLAVVELMRILVDENEMPWERAWGVCTAVFAYTNHTLMAEALEKWSVPLVERVLPRHMQIIYEINRRFLEQAARVRPGDDGLLRRTSLIEEGEPKQVRMANLAVVGGHSVNGVAAIHSELVKTQLFPDYYALFPERFNNKTNGVTQRRWLLVANPGLADLITEAVGDGWITDLDELRGLENFANDASFQERFLAVKRENKGRLARLVEDECGEALDLDALFDVQVKRIHEYKRQLLHALFLAYEYVLLADDGLRPPQPRAHVFAGKAAPGYQAAKQIIRLVNDVAAVVNHDPRCRGLLQAVFVPDYRVSLAEVIIPAADLSEQISTAGTEASGTSNMKFALNGALTMGTLDGANIEIREEVGPENVFIFGLTVAEVQRIHADGSYRPMELYQNSPAVRRVIDAFNRNRFCPREPGRHEWVAQRLLAPTEPYLHLADLESYLKAQDEASGLYKDRAAWAAKAILNVARVGKFSSDRTIRDYAREIWDIKPV